MFTDAPKLLGNPEALASRLAEINHPHIAPLTRFVEQLRTELGPEAAIPFFDPWDGGIEAEVLFLLEAPGAKARNSGFISRNNPDETAKNMFELLSEAKIERKQSVLWNVVPWYIGSENRIRPANRTDIQLGVASLQDLINLLPMLRGVVLVGGKAQSAIDHVRALRRDIFIETSPHPSPLFVNRKPEHRQIILDAFYRVKSRLNGIE